MRITSLPAISLASSLALWLSFSLALVACGGSKEDAEPFDTLQACYDEHHNEESFTTQRAIVVCCLDHPIAGVHPSCKDNQADCVAHLKAELPAVTDPDVTAACMTYIEQK